MKIILLSSYDVSYGRLAQLVRAAALHAVGQGFESLVAHFFDYSDGLSGCLKGSLLRLFISCGLAQE